MKEVVLITGGSSGIGKSIGEFLLNKGYEVYGTSRNPDRYPDSKIRLIPLEVTDINSIQSAVNKVIEQSGGLDVLINNAGAGITGAVEEVPEEEIKGNFETNFFGPLNVIKSVLPQMRSQKSGLIINITSIAAYMGLPYRGVYSASKAALEVITESLSMELKEFNVKICNLAPGDFSTNIASGRYHAPIVKGSPYEYHYSKVLNSIDEDVNKGNDPIKVAEKIHSIITTNNPKIHYKVGAFMQKFSIVLKRILSDRAYEKLLLRHYKM